MPQYNYVIDRDMTGWQNQVITAKIYYAFGTSPKTSTFKVEGISTNDEGFVGIMFDRDLTAEEHETLDTLMETVDGLFPTSGGWTKVSMPSLTDAWEMVEEAGQLEVAYACFDAETGRHVIMIKEDASVTKKTAIRQAIKDTIEIDRIP